MSTEQLSWVGLLGAEPARGYPLRRRIQSDLGRRVRVSTGSGTEQEEKLSKNV